MTRRIDISKCRREPARKVKNRSAGLGTGRLVRKQADRLLSANPLADVGWIETRSMLRDRLTLGTKVRGPAGMDTTRPRTCCVMLSCANHGATQGRVRHGRLVMQLDCTTCRRRRTTGGGERPAKSPRRDRDAMLVGGLMQCTSWSLASVSRRVGSGAAATHRPGDESWPPRRRRSLLFSSSRIDSRGEYPLQQDRRQAAVSYRGTQRRD